MPTAGLGCLATQEHETCGQEGESHGPLVRPACDAELDVVHPHSVARVELSAAPGFGLAVHQDGRLGEKPADLAATAHYARELQ